VIAPVVHHHVILGWHVAADTLRAGATGRMLVVGGDVEFLRQVALGTQSVAFGAQLCSVRFVAVRADDTGLVHRALKEGVVLEDFTVDLPVRMILPRHQEARQRRIEERSVGSQSLGEKMSS
jgi:hypothetical protein